MRFHCINHFIVCGDKQPLSKIYKKENKISISVSNWQYSATRNFQYLFSFTFNEKKIIKIFLCLISFLKYFPFSNLNEIDYSFTLRIKLFSFLFVVVHPFM